LHRQRAQGRGTQQRHRQGRAEEGAQAEGHTEGRRGAHRGAHRAQQRAHRGRQGTGAQRGAQRGAQQGTEDKAQQGHTPTATEVHRQGTEGRSVGAGGAQEGAGQQRRRCSAQAHRGAHRGRSGKGATEVQPAQHKWGCAGAMAQNATEVQAQGTARALPPRFSLGTRPNRATEVHHSSSAQQVTEVQPSDGGVSSASARRVTTAARTRSPRSPQAQPLLRAQTGP
jgi:hypothetical protein